MSTKIIRVIDTETTGLAPPAAVCEVATVDLVIDEDGEIARGEDWQSLCNPGHPIPPEASACHHLTDDDVTDAPSFDSEMAKYICRGPPAAFAAHVAKFDRQFFNPPGIPWICSYKIALWLWPDSPSHSNQCLRYFLKLKFATPPSPHRALGDATVTAAILRQAFMNGATVEQMVEVSSKPAMVRRFTFGKWAMKPIEEIDGGYLQWMVDQKDMDEDCRYSAFTELNRRRIAKVMA